MDKYLEEQENKKMMKSQAQLQKKIKESQNNDLN